MNKPSQKTLGLIIANEFCERFCYYGFRALLFQFLRDVYLENEHAAVKTVHLFNFLCYIFTFMGGILSDNILGRFNTIFYLSIVYLIGTVCTTLSSAFLNKSLLFFGLICIAIGTGGIKPCVSTFGGDQFARDDLNGIKKFFVLFYFAINFGSLISIFTSPMIANMPCLGKDTCYPAAFGLPALLLAVSCVLFVLGSNLYIKKKPNPKILSKLTNCVKIYFVHFNSDQVKSNAIVQAEIAEKHGMAFYLDIVKMLKVLKVFTLVPIFWMLYDQQTTTWIEQGNKMKKVIPMYFTTVSILPSQMQALNGVLILIFIPIFVRIVYPSLDKMNVRLNSLHRMGLGIIFMSLSFFNAATIQYFMSRDIHILWQIPQYVLLTIGEVFLSMTGIEFVYSQSPHDMKGMVLSFWLMAVAVGNIYVVFFTSLDLVHWLSIKNKEIFNFLVYGMFGIVASFYFLRQSNTFKHTQ